MARYRRKPVIVEAAQFDPTKQPWPEGVREIHKGWKAPHDDPPRYNFIRPGAMVGAIRPGDWIVTNQTGERYVVLQEYFEDTYEPVA